MATKNAGSIKQSPDPVGADPSRIRPDRYSPKVVPIPPGRVEDDAAKVCPFELGIKKREDVVIRRSKGGIGLMLEPVVKSVDNLLLKMLPPGDVVSRPLPIERLERPRSQIRGHPSYQACSPKSPFSPATMSPT